MMPLREQLSEAAYMLATLTLTFPAFYALGVWLVEGF